MIREASPGHDAKYYAELVLRRILESEKNELENTLQLEQGLPSFLEQTVDLKRKSILKLCRQMRELKSNWIFCNCLEKKIIVFYTPFTHFLEKIVKSHFCIKSTICIMYVCVVSVFRCSFFLVSLSQVPVTYNNNRLMGPSAGSVSGTGASSNSSNGTTQVFSTTEVGGQPHFPVASVSGSSPKNVDTKKPTNSSKFF